MDSGVVLVAGILPVQYELSRTFPVDLLTPSSQWFEEVWWGSTTKNSLEPDLWALSMWFKEVWWGQTDWNSLEQDHCWVVQSFRTCLKNLLEPQVDWENQVKKTVFKRIELPWTHARIYTTIFVPSGVEYKMRRIYKCVEYKCELNASRMGIVYNQ